MSPLLEEARLAETLAGYKRAAVIAQALGVKAAYEAEYRRYRTLQHYARLLGCPSWSCLEWAEERVRNQEIEA